MFPRWYVSTVLCFHGVMFPAASSHLPVPTSLPTTVAENVIVSHVERHWHVYESMQCYLSASGTGGYPAYDDDWDTIPVPIDTHVPIDPPGVPTAAPSNTLDGILHHLGVLRSLTVAGLPQAMHSQSVVIHDPSNTPHGALPYDGRYPPLDIISWISPRR
eukprot:GHVO01013601.1.p2 GENE.GHVO01013601.1~~GHVO01013601.1.p2  ORF type:complete len:160 (-),score=26.70 GHVO01013601.1:156-635(-)